MTCPVHGQIFYARPRRALVTLHRNVTMVPQRSSVSVMAKKEIQFRPMFGFTGDKPRPAASVTPTYSDKDELIAQLRASLAVLEAKDAERKAKQRERTKKVRAK
jgi:hypothetical protein